jgi:hypothetical protein
MLNVLRMRLAQIADTARANGWRSVCGELAFIKRTAIFVEKDLSEVVERPQPLANAKLSLIEIDKNALSSGRFRFALTHRHLKALRYLSLGYGGFGLVRNNVIVGDMWYFASEIIDDPPTLHVDLRRFGFEAWKASYVYTFDIFVAPTERKGGVSAAFQNNAMLSLRSKGFTKAYGFYFADNVSASWCTRITNKWKELHAASVSRFLMFTRVVPQRKN